MSEERHFITSWQDRHERIRHIADELDAFLEARYPEDVDEGATAASADTVDRERREIHQLRGLCEQLRCDAEGIRLGTDGSKGTKEVQA